jgi:phosphoglycerol transferase MdoB-like AlkP superfamily enzyme
MKNRLFLKIGQLSFPLRVFLLGLIFFTAFRFLSLVYNIDALELVRENKIALVLQSFLIGLRFDALVLCYILVIPFFLGVLAYLTGKLNRLVLGFLYILAGIGFTFSLLVIAADLAFFKYFCKHLNDTIFNWNNAGGFGVKMIFQNPQFCLAGLAYLGILLFFLRFLRGIYRDQIRTGLATEAGLSKALPISLVCIGLLGLGMRGRISSTQPTVAAAYFSDYFFINQLSLSPVYAFCSSYLDRINPKNDRLHFMSDEAALHFAAQDLGGQAQYAAVSPIARLQHTQAAFPGRNVVVVLMESMAAHRMKRYGNTENLTPFLDSLAGISYCFDSAFSSGIHTYNGIYSTLYGHPAMMNKHVMDVTPLPRMDGLSTELLKQGYQTIFFTTHNEYFDNMHDFLVGNDYQQMIGEKDYPESEVLSAVGVPDEYMYRYAMPLLNKLSAKGKPFLATFMSGSNHAPYFIPKNTEFKKHSKAADDAVVEFSDWSLRKLMEYAAKQDWYDSTIFVFIADHGVPKWRDPYEAPFTFHHIPFLIYVPGMKAGIPQQQLTVQTDLFPTVMGLVGRDYVNNTFGIDVLKERHKAIVFSGDDMLYCMNDSLLYIHHADGRSAGLYKYRSSGDVKDYSKVLPEQKRMLEQCAFARLQCSQWMVRH